jgi:hypothetical protein
MMLCCLLVLYSVTSTQNWIHQPRLSWPTPHTTPFFLPPKDPSLVLLSPNSIPE